LKLTVKKLSKSFVTVFVVGVACPPAVLPEPQLINIAIIKSNKEFSNIFFIIVFLKSNNLK
jgi:hypothetical protein